MPGRRRRARHVAERWARRLNGPGGRDRACQVPARLTGRGESLPAFETLRKDRVEELVKAARRNGSRKSPTNALTRGIRDLVLPFFLKIGVKNSQRAYSYRVDWDEKVAWPAVAAREESTYA